MEEEGGTSDDALGVKNGGKPVVINNNNNNNNNNKCLRSRRGILRFDTVAKWLGFDLESGGQCCDEAF